MKRFLAIMLAAMLVLCSFLTAFAENADTSTSQLSQMGDGAPEGTPPEIPEGGFSGGPGRGTPPEMPEGGFPGGTPPEKPDMGGVKREQKQTCLHLAEREHLRRFSTAKVRRFRQTGFSI